MATVKCKYMETNKITSEITVSHILGTFMGITVKERFINENVSFTDIFLCINGNAKVADAFYPHRYNAREWVRAIKAAGAKYICFTTRHHDGFSMWHTKQSKFNIVEATPYGKDVLKELAEACREEGIRLHLYYSHIDWMRDDYPMGRTGTKCGKTRDNSNWKQYYDFMNAQLSFLPQPVALHLLLIM